MDTLFLLPDSDGYALKSGKEVVVNQLDGGAPRIRLDQLNTVGICTVRWTVGQNDYNYLQAFYRTTTLKGSKPFLMDLIFDNAAATEYTVQFVEQTFQLASQIGLQYTVAASLYVTPAPPVAANDNSLVGLYTAYAASVPSGSSPSAIASSVLSQLNILTNVQLPATL